MKTFLMHQDRDFRPEIHWTDHEYALHKDLDLPRLIAAMAAGDEYLAEVAQQSLRTPLSTPAEIEYRQRVLIDVLENPAVIRELYQLATDTIDAERKIFRSIFSHSPAAVLRQSIESLEMLVAMLRSLRLICQDARAGFRSPGFSRFFDMVAEQLDDDYFAELDDHLRRLKFKNGMIIGAGLGRANKGSDYMLSNPALDTRNWFRRIAGRRQESYSFQIHERDEAGHRALAELEGHGVDLAATVLARSDEHIMDFVRRLRLELAFYVGCINLEQLFIQASAPLCFPKPEAQGGLVLSAKDLRDVSLSLAGRGPVIGNDLEADNKELIMVTGANEGGKSTFLRSLGTAQLMMQCGMYVCADYFTAAVASGILTHYKREEDARLKSGKLDEELERMSSIVDTLRPGAMVLFNESFSSTDEREGSAIARDIIRALVDSGMRVVFVTHFYDLAEGIHRLNHPGALLLKAARSDDGTRTFKLVVGEPDSTSFGQDLYALVFAGGPEPAAGPNTSA